MSTEQLRCRICENETGNTLLSAREMMFGTRDRFDYIHCSRCGCVQIASIPENLSTYYPRDYYAFGPAAPETGLRAFLQRRRALHVLKHTDFIGWCVTRARGVPTALQYVRRCGVREHDPILDVGCGSGELLLGMQSWGFTHLTGIDPFVPLDIDYGNGVRILKRSLEEYDGRPRLVMLHHTYEHMGQPREVLGRIHALLDRGGFALLRVPLVSSEAFATYGTDWVQFDAPRHLHLHSRMSIEAIARDCGFVVDNVVFDSTAFQFWGSEQYRNDIPLHDEHSYLKSPAKSIFSRKQMAGFESRARALNASERGDQAAFYLRKS